MRAKDRVNLNICTAALFIVCQTMQCIVLAVQCFYLTGFYPLVPSSSRNKKVATKLNENQKLNLENQYDKHAT